MTACGPVNTSTPPATTAPVATETPPIELHLWVAGVPDDEKILNGQIKTFENANPQISVVMTLIPYEGFDDKLSSTVAAGDAPDIVTLTINSLVYWQSKSSLAQIEIGNFDKPDDPIVGFTPDALASGKIPFEKENNTEPVQYGIPLQQYGCAPVYQYLALFNISKHPNQALSLMNYLTQPDQQKTAYTESGQEAHRIPVRKDVYDSLKLDCPPIPTQGRGSVHRLSLDEIKNAIATTQDMQTAITKTQEKLSPELQKLWEGQELNPYQAISVIESVKDGKVQATAAMLKHVRTSRAQTMQADGGLMLAVAVYEGPAALLPKNIASNEVGDTLIGAISIEQTNSPLAAPYPTEISPEDYLPAGTYLWSCNLNSNSAKNCFFTNTVNGQSFTIVFQSSPVEVPTPVIVAEEGSIIACGYIFNIKVCFRIG
jgi:hypothetical protein